MGSFSFWHWLVVGGLAAILFGGRGKIAELMGDLAYGMKSFKKGLSEIEAVEIPGDGSMRTIDHPAADDIKPSTESEHKA